MVYFGEIMKLTKRQDSFIKNLLDLYKEAQEPIHYTVLAERLGVSRFTAYDMLRVLEEKGFVKSEYKLPDQEKTGRSERLFFPTEAAHRLISAIKADDVEYDWEIIKQRVLEMLQSGEYDNLDIGPELLARVPPESEDSIQYCVEVITIVALHARHNEAAQNLRSYILDLIPTAPLTHRAFLSLLGGFSLGILAQVSKEDTEWMKELFSHVIRFQELVLEFSDDQGRQVAEGIREHFNEMFLLLPQEGMNMDHIENINFKQENKKK